MASRYYRDRVELPCLCWMTECPELPSLGSEDMSDGVCCPQLRMGTRGINTGVAAPDAAADINFATERVRTNTEFRGAPWGGASMCPRGNRRAGEHHRTPAASAGPRRADVGA